MNAQDLSKTLEIEYNNLENLDYNYSTRVKKINEYIDTKRPYIEEIQLSFIYNYFSKFNYRNKDYENAILNGKKALNIQKKFIDSIPSIVNKSYNNLAYMYKNSGNEVSAIKTFKTLIKQSHKDTYVIKAYSLGLSNLYLKRGDYYKAIDYLKEGENTIIKAKKPTLSKELYRIYLGFSMAYYKTGKVSNYTKTIQYLEKTEEVISHLSTIDQKKRRIEIYNGYGNTYDELGQFNKAISYYNKALTLSLNLEKINKSHVSQIYNNLGYIHSRIKKHDIAYKYYQEALRYDKYRTSVYDNLGDYYVFKKDFNEALIHYQKAINHTIKNGENYDYQELPSLDILAQSSNKIGLENYLKDKANAWYKFYLKTKNVGYLRHALSTVMLADKVIDIIRSESSEQQSKYFWRKKGVDLYMLATSICHKLNNSKQAFYFMEKSKALSLLENLTHEEAKNRAILPEYIKDREYNLKQRTYKTIKQLKLDTTYTEQQRQSLIFKQKKEYENFINSLENEYPGYYTYKKEIGISLFDEVFSEHLSSSNNIVQYILNENEGYGLFITNKETHFFKIPDVNILNREILEINKLVSKPFATQLQLDVFTKKSFSAFNKLFPFKNATKLLSNKTTLIIPDYILQSFPFETLITETYTDKNSPSYLIYSAEISYAYSISLLKKIEQKNRNPKSNLIGFAPIHFKNQKLASLNRSTYKMKKIEQQFSGKILYQDQAIKSNFITLANDYNIIHLSTHASAIGNQEPWISFYDEKITLNELYFIKNQADLVILDACKTNIGELQPGEGIMSLSRGFFHSGSRSIISSLWSTNEKSNSKIILNFYANLKKGKSKSTALRQAKLLYLKEHQLSENSPYFWAPLILTGSTKNTLSNEHNYLLYICLLLILIGSIWLIYFRKNKNNQSKKQRSFD
ncbi:CHAT domain-containing protein [Aquimarina sp. AU474]|uniref:CHAT domain-containing protein n=1 Tax=Aquimarina sp. AU474 TaxID=2108529 RepID=UPI00135B253A|nr:CHAT domain-containing protein [Aquimarina sp. AU474]